MDYDKVANELVLEPFMKPGWSARDLAIWLRDGCRCVYCDKDRLQSYDVLFYDSAYDHLLPVKRYEALKDADWNRVLACRACSTIKHTFDPSREPLPTGEAAPIALHAASGSRPSETDRLRYIEHVKSHIESQRSAYRAVFPKQRRAIVKALRQPETSLAAAGVSSRG